MIVRGNYLWSIYYFKIFYNFWYKISEVERIKIDFFSLFNDKLKVNIFIFKGGVYIK